MTPKQELSLLINACGLPAGELSCCTTRRRKRPRCCRHFCVMCAITTFTSCMWFRRVLALTLRGLPDLKLCGSRMVNAAFIARRVIIRTEWECRRCFMFGSRLFGSRWFSTPLGLWSILWFGACACFAAQAAADDNCPGHPDAIGTSRTIVVD